MNAPDLRTGPPPRWSETVDGVAWLPRFAAKARAYDAGTLGMYLYGQSPVDDAFLKRAEIDYDAFLEIVRSAPDDAAVLAEIDRRTPGAADWLRRWSSEKLPAAFGWLLAALDVDDGYTSSAVVKRLANACAVPVVLAARAFRGSPKTAPGRSR